MGVLILVVALGLFSHGKTQAQGLSSKPTVVHELNFSLDRLAFSRPVVTIEKKETSPYLDKVAAEKKAAAQRLAQATVVRPRPILTVKPTVKSVPSGPVKLYRDHLFGWLGCVNFAKYKTGIYRTLGNGARKAIQGREPRVGAIGAMTGRVHAVVVTAVNGDQITFVEAGYLYDNGWWITQRTAPKSSFLGFVYN